MSWGVGIFITWSPDSSTKIETQLAQLATGLFGSPPREDIIEFRHFKLMEDEEADPMKQSL